jgi:hypothetical protein
MDSTSGRDYFLLQHVVEYTLAMSIRKMVGNRMFTNGGGAYFIRKTVRFPTIPTSLSDCPSVSGRVRGRKSLKDSGTKLFSRFL